MSAFAAASISTSITAGAAAPARRSLVRRSSVRARRHTAGIVTTSAVANAADENNNDDDNKDAAERVASRREALAGTALAAALALSTTAETVTMRPALAAGLPKVVVVGATGQTGQLVVAELRKRSDAEVIAAVRSGGKAKKMGLDAGGVTLLPGFDVTGKEPPNASRSSHPPQGALHVLEVEHIVASHTPSRLDEYTSI